MKSFYNYLNENQKTVTIRAMHASVEDTTDFMHDDIIKFCEETDSEIIDRENVAHGKFITFAVKDTSKVKQYIDEYDRVLQTTNVEDAGQLFFDIEEYKKL